MHPDIGQLFKEYQELADSKAEFKARIISYEEKIKSIEERIQAIEKSIEVESKRTKRASSATNHISEDVRRIKFAKEAINILQAENMCLTIRSIVDVIKKLHTIEETPSNDRYVLNKVSNDLRARSLKNRDFNRIKHDGEYYYGLIEWFSPEGAIPASYLGV